MKPTSWPIIGSHTAHPLGVTNNIPNSGFNIQPQVAKSDEAEKIRG